MFELCNAGTNTEETHRNRALKNWLQILIIVRDMQNKAML